MGASEDLERIARFVCPPRANKRAQISLCFLLEFVNLFCYNNYNNCESLFGGNAMKKLCAVLAVLLIVVSGKVCAEESQFYVRSFLIEKIYPHALGWKVMYITSRMSYATTYLPHAWFSQSSSKGGVQAKGEIIWGNNPAYPYMLIFWKDGKFSHARLFLKKDMRDVSYGVISPNQDPASFNVEEPSLEY
jgi:hypothetical protein